MLPAVLPARAESASSLYRRGQDAEAREDYVAAYNYYEQAFRMKPKDVSYRTAMARTRFEAGAQLVHRGQLLRDHGRLEEALAEFQKAATTDPSSTMAEQEVRRTQAMIKAASGNK
jgi:tetratricopeptide (TPR) repeat protein